MISFPKRVTVSLSLAEWNSIVCMSVHLLMETKAASLSLLLWIRDHEAWCVGHSIVCQAEFFGYAFRSHTHNVYDASAFHFLRDFHTDFSNICARLQSHLSGVSKSSWSPMYLLAFVTVSFPWWQSFCLGFGPKLELSDFLRFYSATELPNIE